MQPSDELRTLPLSPALYIGDSVSSPSLRQAQTYVDLLTRPPPAAPRRDSRPGGASQRTSAAHPFRQVLDTLAAARKRRREEAALARRRQGGNRDAARRQLGEQQEGAEGEVDDGDEEADELQSSSQARLDLQHAFGPFAGSAMFRDWVLQPRAHLQGVSRDLSAAVVSALRPHAAALSLDAADSLAVHVQLLPSGTGPPHAPFCALVTVRHARPLDLQEEEQAALAARLLSAAAPGQTVASSLRFWRGVSYGDVGEGQGSEMGNSTTAAAAKALREAGVEHCAALGLRSVLAAPWAEDSGEPAPDMEDGAPDAPPTKRRRGEKASGQPPRLDTKREARTATPAAAAAVVVVPGTWSSVREQFMDRFAGGRSRQQLQHQHLAREVQRTVFDWHHRDVPWRQPDAFLSQQNPDQRSVKRARDGEGAVPLMSPRGAVLGSGVRMGGCGLALALYVSVEGVAYIAYPPPSPSPTSQQMTTTPVAGESKSKSESEAGEGEPSLHAGGVIPWCGFAVEAKDSFTRGLLGL